MSDKSVFETLNSVNVNNFTEKKGGLTYLSWSYAVQEAMARYPDMTYEVVRGEDGRPYIHDPATGYMVFTRVTIQGQTKEMWLPVMDHRNKAMNDNATMTDINKAIMRCLTKNLAMFGLGLYIYAGEDLPSDQMEEKNSGLIGSYFNQIYANLVGRYEDRDLVNKACKEATIAFAVDNPRDLPMEKAKAYEAECHKMIDYIRSTENDIDIEVENGN